ncbi:A1A0 archaeal ATP synthase subunit E AhaE [Methanobrevibacter ruminantium M1]|uniref:A-type ATP synthase subunit E n=1 Tax=Methanobrevibacter ruminantium (strain ATCC 35063 / DSM 1093 / JCM 13430 / OCM 146 / M1) TaxID=634498 RepID=D3E1Y8_METRM|nr:V-type proton ATPase subunit E [Methanobrevibacter ruminantium]ADC46549.1 A1A0 archaeal ATP synthase subunit E AhaE [Methanobrevibacter ruminantium M1]
MSSGADKIVSNIMSEAQGKADANIGEAQAQVDAILADGEKRAEATKLKISEDAAKQAEMRYQQIISEAKMNARRAELGAKEEVIEEAFNKATEDLTNMANTNDTEYVDALIEMIKEAAVEIGGGDLIVLLKKEDIPKIEGKLEHIVGLIKSLIKREKPSDLNVIAKEVSRETDVETTLEIGEPIDTIGGAILRTRNGEIQVNNTIESRMLRFKKSLRSEVAKTLFD